MNSNNCETNHPAEIQHLIHFTIKVSEDPDSISKINDCLREIERVFNEKQIKCDACYQVDTFKQARELLNDRELYETESHFRHVMEHCNLAIKRWDAGPFVHLLNRHGIMYSLESVRFFAALGEIICPACTRERDESSPMSRFNTVIHLAEDESIVVTKNGMDQ